MKTKLLGVMLVSGALLFMCGCTPKTTPPPDSNLPTGDVTGTEQSTPAQTGDTGKMTDAIWVEMAAQDLYHSVKDPAAWGIGGGRERMFSRYGVTEAQLEAYGTLMSSKPEHALELMGKMADRVKELEQK